MNAERGAVVADQFRLGDRCISPSSNEIDGVRIDPKAMDVLVALVEVAPLVISAKALLDRVWPDLVVVDNVVYQTIAQLRKALDDDAREPRFIETIPRRGYRLIAHLSMVPPEKVPISSSNVTSSGSIAVLRFVDMSQQRDQSPLCEGIAEEILNRLARIRDLKVIARTSSFQFDPSNTDIREVGRRLGVHHVLEGSVRTAGNQVRIAAQLIECEGESQLWSESYTRELVDLFTLYDEVANVIARELKLVISDALPKSIVRPTQSEEALKLVMQVRFELPATRNPRDLFPLVERAIELDSDYAEAHLEKGELYFTLADHGHEPPEPSYRSARQCVEKALLLDPNLAEAHGLMGMIRSDFELDWGLAAESRRQADLLRGYPRRFGTLCLAGYYAQAERNCRQTIERDPLNIDPRFWLARALDRLGRIDEATEQYQTVLDMAPRSGILFGDYINHLLDFAGDVERAEQLVRETKGGAKGRYSRGSSGQWARARIAHARGDSAPMRALVDGWVANRETQYVRAMQIEWEYYRLGDYEAHIHWFAVREREKDLLTFVPMFTLRDRPDYWDNLTNWALDDFAEARSRMGLLNKHRARIDRITEKMVLPPDFVA